VSALDEITRFQTDRGLDKKPFDWNIEATNIIEELLEAVGVNDRNIAIMVVGDMQLRIDERTKQGLVVAPSVEDQVDAFADVIVFACGALTKLGYDPEKVLIEVGKEINSREGVMINGKFVKHKTPEAKAKWYKANFSKCKMTGVTERQRKAFFATEGYMGSDEEVLVWVQTMIST
jgi:predicted HAD superfamily Cof-like phosphohydrolase